VGAELFHADRETDRQTDGQTDMTKLIVALRTRHKTARILIYSFDLICVCLRCSTRDW